MHHYRIPAAFAAVTLTFAVAACGGDDESVFNAEVGECIEQVSDLSGQVDTLPETTCDEEHEAEIFFLVEHEGSDDDFPGQDELEAEAAEECEGDEFEDYTGVDYFDTAIAVRYVTPSAASWGDGDRETICILVLPGETVDESFRGNGDEYPLGDGGDGGDGGGTGEAGDPEEPPSIDDPELAELADACFEGSGQACDDLYFQAEEGSEAEDYGNTCGRRFESSPGFCATAIGGGTSDGSDTGSDSGGGSGEAGDPEEPPSIDDPDLAALAEACYEGSGEACDNLYFGAPAGSEAEAYGDTCGRRFDSSPGLCSTAIGG